MRLSSSLSIALLVVGAACTPKFPHPPRQCDPDGKGCLSDEICQEGKCLPRERCASSEECPSVAFECVLPAQVCQLREGFGVECSADAPCDPGLSCQLGVCVPIEGQLTCSSALECPVGLKCSRTGFFCIQDGPCTLAEEFPELACDPDQVCDALTGRCVLPCQNECTVDEDCGSVLQCDGSCRCVQCIGDGDCGPGLVCNSRAGQCVPENQCFSDADCESPLVCDRRIGLCASPPPPCEDDFDCQIAEVCNAATQQCELPTGPCIDDSHEESDTPVNADEIDVQAGGSDLVDGLQLCPDDDDVYAVTLHTGDTLTAEVLNTLPAAHATVWLLDSTAELTLRFAETPPYGNGTIRYTAQSEERVFVRVNALVGATPYDLQVSIDSGGLCQNDVFEGGTGNEDPLSATPPELLPTGVGLAGAICPGDVDFYRVNLSPGEALVATVAFDASAYDLDVAFLNDQEALLAQQAGTSAPEVLRKRFVMGGPVFVRVSGFGNTFGPYTLTFDKEAPFVCTADAAEDDDDVLSAVPVASNSQVIAEARTVCLQDVDFLAVPLEDFERLVVQTRYADSDVELAVDVLDATGSVVLASAPPATDGAAVSYDATGNQSVVVRIAGKLGAIGPYVLDVSRENQLDCAPDVLEPNDDTPVTLPLPNQLLSICNADEDLFRIHAEAGKKIVVDASFRQADADIDLLLLGLDGAQILAAADGTSDGEHLEFLATLDGDYTLRVFSLTNNPKARYTLDARVVTP